MGICWRRLWHGDEYCNWTRFNWRSDYNHGNNCLRHLRCQQRWKHIFHRRARFYVRNVADCSGRGRLFANCSRKLRVQLHPRTVELRRLRGHQWNRHPRIGGPLAEHRGKLPFGRPNLNFLFIDFLVGLTCRSAGCAAARPYPLNFCKSRFGKLGKKCRY